MTCKTIAFLYNVRHRYPDPNDPASQVETDFDDPPTITQIISHLQACGYEVIPIEADENAYLQLHARRPDIDLVFNYAMGIHGAARYAQLPAMLEMLRLPYTGSDPLTQALVLNKARMQEVLAANDVPVLRSQVFHAPGQSLRPDLHYPLIVKPLAQGSSAGITEKSVVHDAAELLEAVGRTIGAFREPALVQPFLEGREFSVPMVGNPPRVLPIIEPDFSKLPAGYTPLDSLEIKWIFEEQSESHHLVCPARLDDHARQRVEALAHGAWTALQIRDWCRIDMRCDSAGHIYVLDVNSPPGIIPPEISTTSYFPLSARAAGIGYPELLRLVIESACARLRIAP